MLMVPSVNTVQRRLDDLGWERKHIKIKSKKTSRSSEDGRDARKREIDEGEAQKKKESVWKYCGPKWSKRYSKGSMRKSQAISKVIRENANYIVSQYFTYPFQKLLVVLIYSHPSGNSSQLS